MGKGSSHRAGTRRSQQRFSVIFSFKNPEVSAPQKDVILASEQALEVLHKSMKIEMERADDKWASVLSILEEKLELVASRVGIEVPKFVLNNSGKCKVHLTRNDRFTVCGWEWHGHKHAVARTALAKGDNVCTKCCATP